MLNVLIVDDETIVRSSLSGIVEWEKEGCHIVGSAANGKAALNILQSQRVDLLFTDIKMPILDGIELLERLGTLAHQPMVVVLSAYDEFNLVRQAFRLGAKDYMLKSDITPAYMLEILARLRQDVGALPTLCSEAPCEETPAEHLRRMALGDMEGAESFLPAVWRLGCLEIDSFKTQSLRFGDDLNTSLIQPMLQFAAQVPRVAAKCVITPISHSRFVLLFTGDVAATQARSICAQVQRVWADYMNLTTTGGTSGVGTATAQFQPLLQQCYANLTLKYIFGTSGTYTPNEQQLFNVKKALARQQQLQPLLSGMRSMKAQDLINSQQALFASFWEGDLPQARTLALETVYNIEMQLLDAGVDIWKAFNTESDTDFYQKVSVLSSVRDVELWITEIIRWVTDYFGSVQVSSKMDIMDKAKHFIADNYADPSLNLAAVAGYVRLSEKYFSTRFNREEGVSFVSYLIQLRISRAKQLILKTDMKMYEVSDAVGFTSVEHFTRVFKKHTGVSPKSYHGNRK